MKTVLDECVLNKALAILSIENALLEVGNKTYDYVADLVNKEYHCGLTDCYEHPEYLSAILKRLYGNSYGAIVESIKNQLEEFSNRKSIGRFVEILSQ